MNAPSPACQAILANISGYLDGELDRTACDAIERHCQQCARCAALVTGLRETVGLCREAGSAPLPEAVRQRARDSVRELLDRASKGD
jgi:anti-sigma factor RsiW